MAPFLSLMVIPNLRCFRTAAKRANPIYHGQERRPMKLRALFPLTDWAQPVSSSNAVTILGKFLSGRLGSGHHGVESLASRLTIPRNKSGIGNPTFLSLLYLMSLLCFCPLCRRYRLSNLTLTRLFTSQYLGNDFVQADTVGPK